MPVRELQPNERLNVNVFKEPAKVKRKVRELLPGEKTRGATERFGRGANVGMA